MRDSRARCVADLCRSSLLCAAICRSVNYAVRLFSLCQQTKSNHFDIQMNFDFFNVNLTLRLEIVQNVFVLILLVDNRNR